MQHKKNNNRNITCCCICVCASAKFALPNPNELRPDNKFEPNGKLNKLFDCWLGGCCCVVSDDDVVLSFDWTGALKMNFNSLFIIKIIFRWMGECYLPILLLQLLLRSKIKRKIDYSRKKNRINRKSYEILLIFIFA